MTKLENLRILVIAGTITISPIANAASDLPWEKFVPFLVLFPIAIILIVLTSKKTPEDGKRGRDNEKSDS